MDRATLIEHISQLCGKLIVGVEYKGYDFDTEEDIFEFAVDSGVTVTVREPVINGEAKHNPNPSNVVEFKPRKRNEGSVQHA